MSKINRLFYMLKAERSCAMFQMAESFLRKRMDQHSYVSFSAGKDSSVIAHMAHKINPQIPILMVDPGVPTHWLDSERRMWFEYAEKEHWNLVLFPWDKWTKKRSSEHLGELHKDMFEDLSAYAKEHGLTTRIMGLRAQESKGRRCTIYGLGSDYIYKDGTRRLLPISSWDTDAVWSYIISRDIPYLSIYELLGPDARNGLIGVNGAENGRIVFLKKYYPRAYEEAKKLLPKEVLNHG